MSEESLIHYSFILGLMWFLWIFC